MSEPLVRDRHSIDLDEFERRLRQPDGGDDHPLANLARLVDEHDDPYGDVFADPVVPFPQNHAETGRREPAFETPSSRLGGDFAAIEAGLRGALAAHPEAAPYGDVHEFQAQHEHFAQDEPYAHDEQYAQHDAYIHDHAAPASDGWAAAPHPHAAAPAAAGRGRRPLYTVAATIAVGVIGIGVAFAFKGAGSSPREIKTIAAAAGPTKIQPPAEASNDTSSQDAGVLNKDGRDAPTQLVSREEQPVDLGQAVQESNSRNADTGTSSQGDASNIPLPLSPNEARNAPASPESSSSDATSSFGAGMPSPKKVKVVSVRPDGTILPDDAPPAAALPQVRVIPARAAEDADPIARASTPNTAAPKATGAKTTSRVAAQPKPAKIASDDSAADDAPAPKPAKKAKPLHVASAEPTDGADDTTASLGSKTAGGWAVQLAAPGSESDARSASSRFAKKYAEALSGHRIGFHKAQSNGKSVYRVRVGSLSKADAVSLCGKLKSAGGSCFIAKNN